MMKKSKLAIFIVIYTMIGICVSSLLVFSTKKKADKKLDEYRDNLRECTEEIQSMQDIIAEQRDDFAQLDELVTELESNLNEANKKMDYYKDVNYGIKAYGRLQVNGTKLCGENGEQVQLKGMSTHGLAWYPRYTNAAAIKALKDVGANVIRLAVYSEQNDSYLYEAEENKNYLYNAIENALVQNMYVIVDWHVLKDENPNVHKDKAKEFFTEISSHYGNNSGIIYEICNEPNGDTTWNDIYEYAMEIIPVIRKNAPDAVIIVGTPGHSFDVEKVSDRPLQFDNIMYAFHVYVDVTDKEVSDLNWLERKLDTELPIFVTEWGITDEANEGGKLYKDKAIAFMNMMKERGISWCNWSLSNKDEVYSMFKPSCTKYSGWTEDDLTFSGSVVLEGLNN